MPEIQGRKPNVKYDYNGRAAGRAAGVVGPLADTQGGAADRRPRGDLAGGPILAPAMEKAWFADEKGLIAAQLVRHRQHRPPATRKAACGPTSGIGLSNTPSAPISKMFTAGWPATEAWRRTG